MAVYVDAHVVTKGFGAAFERRFEPGAVSPYSGIYRCETSGDEIVAAKGQPLPVVAAAAQGSVPAWKLVVYAEHRHR